MSSSSCLCMLLGGWLAGWLAGCDIFSHQCICQSACQVSDAPLLAVDADTQMHNALADRVKTLVVRCFTTQGVHCAAGIIRLLQLLTARRACALEPPARAQSTADLALLAIACSLPANRIAQLGCPQIRKIHCQAVFRYRASKYEA